MAKLTHTVSGNVASFRSADKTNIESLKVHFVPVQAGTGDPSPSNVRAISGWNGVEVNKQGKNVGHIIGYSASTVNSTTGNRNLTGNYGTTISTTNYALPDTSLIITQSQWPNTNSIYSYQNGYFCIAFDNLIFNQSYDFSFKITNITNNPLNAQLSQIKINSPGGGPKSPTEIKDNILIFRNVTWEHHSISYNRCTLDVYNCGMSFTISEVIVTPAYMNDGVFEPYCGSIMPITFPNVGKNKLEITALSYDDWTGEGYYNSYLDRMNPVIDTTNATITIDCQGSGDSVLYKKTHYPPGTYTLSYDMTYSGTGGYVAKRMVVMCFDENDQIMTNEQVSLENLTWNKYYKGFYNTPRTFTVPNTVSYFTICFGIAGDSKGETAVFSNIQLEVGSTTTTYEPYSFSNTLYGGYVDVATGEIWKTHILFSRVVADMDNNESFPGWKNCPEVKLMEGYVDNSEDGYRYNLVGDIATRFYYNSKASATPIVFLYGTLKQDMTQTEWKANYPNLVFNWILPLATPQLVGYLTSTELQTFLNYNNIWSDTNSTTEVTYEVIDHLAQKRASIPKQRRKVLWNQWLQPLDADNWQAYNTDNITATFNNGISTTTWTSAKTGYSASIRNKVGTLQQADQIWYVSYMVQSDTDDISWGVEFCGGLQPWCVSHASANTWYQCSAVGAYYRGTRNYTYIVNCKDNLTEDNIGMKAYGKAPILINLTQMFGKGNEPTKAEFEALCKLNHIDLTQYQEYNEGIEQLWYIDDNDTKTYKTVEWNQLLPVFGPSYWEPYSTTYSSVTFDGGTATRTVVKDCTSSWNASIRTKSAISTDTSHKYYIKQELNSSIEKIYVLTLGGNWSKQVTVAANTWGTYETIGIPIQSEKMYVVYDGNGDNLSKTGEICQVRNPVLIDLTQMFGAGNEPSSIAEFRRICTLNNIDLDTAFAQDLGSTQLWRIK